MRAKMRNGKILTGKIAEIFIKIGVAEAVEEETQANSVKNEPQADELTKPKHTAKRSAPKRKGSRPKKVKK